MTSLLNKRLAVSVVDIMFQLENAEETSINPDFAISIMESVSADLQGLDEAELNEFISIIKEEANNEVKKNRKLHFENFAENFGLQ